MNIERIIKYSCRKGPNSLDWYRSLYFALFGTSFMAFSLKATVLLNASGIFYILGVIGFALGLSCSIPITDRFKGFSLEFTKEEKGKTSFIKYYMECEMQYINFRKKGNKKILGVLPIKETTYIYLQHLLFNFILFPSFLFIGLAGYMIEKNNLKNSESTNNSFNNINTKVEQIESEIQTYNNLKLENKSLMDSIQFSKIERIKHLLIIDSLGDIINKKSHMIPLKSKNLPNKTN